MRVTNSQLLIAFTLLTSSITSVTVHGQQPANRKNEQALRQQIEITAINSLESLSDELRDVPDMSTRIGMTGEIVKLLGSKRPARCRQLLDSLFDDALQLRKTTATDRATPTRPDVNPLIQKIIKIAAAFDHKLAQSYLDKSNEEDELTNGDENKSRSSAAAAEANLQFATELVDKDVALAISVAQRSLASAISPRVLVFLETLRRKDAQAANNFLMTAAQSVKARGANNINELFVLYAYIFSPLRIPFVAPEGLAVLQAAYQNIGENRAPDPTLARRFLELSTDIFLDPARYSHVEMLSTGVRGDFYFIKLIEPQAATFMPASLERLTAQESVLLSYLNPDQRSNSQNVTDQWNNNQADKQSGRGGDSSSIESILERADKVSDPGQKDQLYYRAAVRAVREKNYKWALEIADKMSSETADSAKPLIAFGIADAEIKDHHIDEAEALAKRDSDLTRRAYLLNLAASSLTSNKKDLERAVELINQVQEIAGRIDSKQEKVSTLIGSAAVCSRFDTIRSLNLLQEAIEIANKIDNFTGDTRINRSIKLGDFFYHYPMYQDELTFNEIIRKQGLSDFNSTLAQLQNLKSRTPRFNAIIALCGVVLSG